jgi:dihydroorotase
MNPPLRQEADRKAVIEGLVDGTIDMIATDHAPHASHEKEREFDQAPFGIIGLETAFSLGYGLVESGDLTLEKLILLMANHPAKHFNLPVGEIRIGGLADFALLDLSRRQTVEKGFFRSKSRNSPFLGSVIGGEVQKTFMDGHLVFDRANVKEVAR